MPETVEDEERPPEPHLTFIPPRQMPHKLNATPSMKFHISQIKSVCACFLIEWIGNYFCRRISGMQVCEYPKI